MKNMHRKMSYNERTGGFLRSPQLFYKKQEAEKHTHQENNLPMQTELRITTTQLVIYQKMSNLLATLLVIGTVCGAPGGIFFYQGIVHNDLFLILVGGFFLFVGVSLFIQLISALTKLLTKKESIVFEADKRGITIAPIINMKPVSYRWKDIDRIILAERRTIKGIENTPLTALRDIRAGKGFDTEYSGKSSESCAENVMMIFFHPALHRDLSFIARNTLQVWRSPEGGKYSVIECPKYRLPDIRKKLSEITSDPPEIILCSHVEFDYINQKEKSL